MLTVMYGTPYSTSLRAARRVCPISVRPYASLVASVSCERSNSFAAAPASILKDSLVARGGKGAVMVRRLALDCRAAGRRDALVDVEYVLGEKTGSGSASVPTPDGNYSAAFSLAVEKAYSQAAKSAAEAR